MKEYLDEQSRIALIGYRLQRADESVAEAELLARENHYNAAFNRMYYACFYATCGLLLSHEITAGTHAGVKAQLNLHFVSTGIITKECGKLFARLFEIRHSSDYDDFVYCDKEMYDEFIPRVRSYIQTIKELLERQ